MMEGFSILNPSFLPWLLSLAVPAAILLVVIRKYKTQVVSSLAFIQAARVKRSHHIRVMEILLMLLRILILFCIVFAFLRPQFREKSVHESALLPRDYLFILDGSFSMHHARKGVSCFVKAKKELLEHLKTVLPNEKFIVVIAGSKPRILCSSEDDLKKVEKILAETEAGCSSSSFLSALQLGGEALDYTRRKRVTVYVFSDFQETFFDFDMLAEFVDTVSFSMDFIPVDVSWEEKDNVAVTDIKIKRGSKQEVIICAKLENFSDREVSELPVNFYVNDEKVKSRNVCLRARGSTTVEFHYFLDGRKLFHGRVDAGQDNLGLDNKRYFVIDNTLNRKILLLDGEISKPVYRSASFNLAFILHPDNLSEKGYSPFGPEILLERDLSGYDAVVLAHVNSIDEKQVGQLENFVENGGRLVFFLGSDVNQDFYNGNTMKNIFPFIIEDKAWKKEKKGNAFYMFCQEETSAMANPKLRKAFEAVKFYNTFFCCPRDGVNARIITRFDNGREAVMEAEVGKGHVALVPFSATSRWSDMPRRWIYVPFVLDLVAGHQHGKNTAENNFLVGMPVRFEGGELERIYIVGPRGRGNDLFLGRDNCYVFELTDEPGIYMVNKHAGRRIQKEGFTVNIDPGESKLTSIKLDKIEGLKRVFSASGKWEQKAGSILQIDRERNWLWLFWFAITFLFVELFLARKVYT